MESVTVGPVQPSIWISSGYGTDGFVQRCQLEAAIIVFQDGRAVLDPITAVIVCNSSELFDGGRMNMSADDAIAVALARVQCHHFFKAIDIADSSFDILLHVQAIGLVLESELPADPI